MKKEKIHVAYPTFCEYRKKQFLNMAAVVGIGVTASSISMEINADENKAAESNKAEKADNTKIKDGIILLVANLGNDDFKKREKSTSELICMGQKFKKEKSVKLVEFLKAELEKCKDSKDPEVKERARKILLAITPAPPNPPNRRIRGKIAPAGW